jgi:hypothetical protein
MWVRAKTAIAARDPEAILGKRVFESFGPRLPFLMKRLADAEPLSLQVHPTSEHARIRYAEQNAAGIPLDAPERKTPVPDPPRHRPDLLGALRIHSEESPGELSEAAAATERRAHQPQRLRRPHDLDVARESIRVFAQTAALIDRLEDAGVIVMLFLNHVIAPGMIHAYTSCRSRQRADLSTRSVCQSGRPSGPRAMTQSPVGSDFRQLFPTELLSLSTHLRRRLAIAGEPQRFGQKLPRVPRVDADTTGWRRTVRL